MATPLLITYAVICTFPWATFQFGAAPFHIIAAYSPSHGPLPATAWDERIFASITRASEYLG